MMSARGHYIIHYGHEDSDVICNEQVSVITNKDWKIAYGDYDWRKNFFKFDVEDYAYKTFFKNAIEIQNSLGQINGKFCRAFYWAGPGFNYSDMFNINSITNYGGGLYDFVFTNSMPSDKYTVIVSAQHSRDINNGNRIFFHVRNRASNAFRVETIGGNGETGTFDALDFACIIYSSSFFH